MEVSTGDPDSAIAGGLALALAGTIVLAILVLRAIKRLIAALAARLAARRQRVQPPAGRVSR